MRHAPQGSQYGQEWVLAFLQVPQLLWVLPLYSEPTVPDIVLFFLLPNSYLSSGAHWPDAHSLLHLPIPATHAEVMAR